LSSPPLTLCLAQLSPRLGDVGANLELHREAIARASEQDARLVIFPELSLTGYRLRDLTFEVAIARDSRELDEFAKLSRGGPDLLVGFVEESPDHRFYNAAAYFSAGRLVHVHRKVYLPTYGLFEEGRFFAMGSEFMAFDTGIGRLGVLICEDVWHLSSAYAYFLQNVDWLLVMSAAPGRGLPEEGDEPSSGQAWNSLLVAVATFFNCGVFYVNRVGWEDGVKFWGGSKVVDPFGTVRGHAGQVEPELCFVDVDPAELRLARINTPIRRDERPELLRGLIEDITRGGGRRQ